MQSTTQIPPSNPPKDPIIAALLSLLLLGGVTIQSFLVVLLIGVISGTYSSIFVASQILVSWEEGDLGRILGRFFPRLAPAPGAE